MQKIFIDVSNVCEHACTYAHIHTHTCVCGCVGVCIRLSIVVWVSRVGPMVHMFRSKYSGLRIYGLHGMCTIECKRMPLRYQITLHIPWIFEHQSGCYII